MATPVFNRERAARVLVDAIAFGDRTACRTWKITARTLGRYRARLSSDPELSALVHSKGEKADRDWAQARLQSLRKALAKADELVAKASKPEHLGDVTEHIRVIGELDIAAKVLHGGDNGGDGADNEGAEPATTPSPTDGGEGKA
jgi:hypothetical protein